MFQKIQQMLQEVKTKTQELPVSSSLEHESPRWDFRSYQQKCFLDTVPQKYRSASLETMDKQPKELVEFGRKWAKNPRSLFLFGNKGAGKTHFTFALIRELFQSCPRHYFPRFYTSPSLDSDLCNAVMNGGDAYMLDQISNQEFLIIDDFGRETKSDRIKRQYFEIINHRYSHELLTILTSNFDLRWIEENLSDVIASRLQEFQCIQFNGDDLRKPEIIL